jgi:hypothetical protein
VRDSYIELLEEKVKQKMHAPLRAIAIGPSDRLLDSYFPLWSAPRIRAMLIEAS